jgi:hypothetical protein
MMGVQEELKDHLAKATARKAQQAAQAAVAKM